MKVVKAKQLLKTRMLGFADQMGGEYAAARESARSYSEQADDIGVKIKQMAEQVGEEAKPGLFVVKGKQYVVGYSVVEGSPVFDLEAAIQEGWSTELIKRITVRVVDPEKLTQAVESGLISKKVFLKHMKPSAKAGTKRLYVQTRRDFDLQRRKEQDEAEK